MAEKVPDTSKTEKKKTTTSEAPPEKTYFVRQLQGDQYGVFATLDSKPLGRIRRDSKTKWVVETEFKNRAQAAAWLAAE